MTLRGRTAIEELLAADDSGAFDGAFDGWSGATGLVRVRVRDRCALGKLSHQKLRLRSIPASQLAFELSGAELERFNALHTRGFGGKFGHKLAQLAGVGVNDQNTEIKFPQVNGLNRDFDWDEPDEERPNSGFTYLNITAPTTRIDDEDGEPYEDEATVYLHMTEQDYDELGRVLGAAILHQKLREHPFPADDPRALYIESLLDLQDPDVLQFDKDANPWHDDQHFEVDFNRTAGTWRIIAQDADGDEVDMTLSPREFEALHAQLMRRIGTGPEPAQAAPNLRDRQEPARVPARA